MEAQKSNIITGQAITDETEQFVEELKTNKLKSNRCYWSEVQVLKDTLKYEIEEYNKQVQNIKNLTDSVKIQKKCRKNN